ncbi:MAG: hypothetical protein IJZ42_10325 [Lachnospiraceae bacterium]|nr:hypothetical protein [Lachnospiraceae bacterium]
MKKLNQFVYIKDESLVYYCGNYNVPNELPAGEYYIWGNSVYYEYSRQKYSYNFGYSGEGYDIFKKKDKVFLKTGMMTPIENIGYINKNVKILYPNHVYRTELEIPTGFYLFKFDEKYYVKTEDDLEENECFIDLYEVYSDSWKRRERGKYGCIEITSKIKHITIYNGVAEYYGQTKFDVGEILENIVVPKNQIFDMEKSAIYNEIIDMRLFFRYQKGGRFLGTIPIDVLGYDCYIINGECKWRAKINPFFEEALNSIIIRFKSSDGFEEIKTISGFQNIRYKYDDERHKKCYIIETELSEKMCHSEFKLTLLAYNEFEVNEDLIDFVNAENYMDDYELENHYKDDFILLKNVLKEVEGIDVEYELKCLKKMPEIVHLILPTLKDIVDKKQVFKCNNNDEEETVFEVEATYNKAFYCIAKIADKAKAVYTKNDGEKFVIIYSNSQVESIMQTNFILEQTNSGYVNEKIRNYLQKNCFEYYAIEMAMKCISKLCQESGYIGLYKNSILRRIIDCQKGKIKRQIDKVYSDIVKENRVPTRWGNEYRLFSLISNYNSNAQYQYHSTWLGRQSLDIYIPENRIGIEYQGEQHYNAVEIWGGEEALEKNQKRDLRKKKLCMENNVRLLEWTYKMPVNEKNVIKFMKDNSIPFVNKESNIQVRTEMAPIIEPTKKEVKEKPVKKEMLNEMVIKYYIVQYGLDGRYTNKYENIKIAAEEVGISSTSISKVLRGERNSAGGYIWKVYNPSEEIPETINVDFDISLTNSGKSYMVEQYTVDGKLLRKYDSVADAEKETNISRDSIKKVVNGKAKTAGGYIWKKHKNQE